MKSVPVSYKKFIVWLTDGIACLQDVILKQADIHFNIWSRLAIFVSCVNLCHSYTIVSFTLSEHQAIDVFSFNNTLQNIFVPLVK
jgi:hypothetical protein